MLAQSAIKTLMSKGTVTFDGELRGDAGCLTLGQTIQRFSEGHTIDCTDESSVKSGYDPPEVGWEEFLLLPFKTVLVATAEFLRVPDSIGGAIGTLSHLARLGVFAHLGAPFIMPGFSGYLALELFNASPNAVRLRPGLPVAKVVFLPVIGASLSNEQSTIHHYSSSANTIPDLRSQIYLEVQR